MPKTRHTKCLIIGSGPAGYTAGVYAARAMLEPMLVQGIEPGGQLTTTTEVENWPGDAEVQGPDLMVRMEAHAKAMGCEIVGDIITDLDTESRPFTAKGDSGATIDAPIVGTFYAAPSPDSDNYVKPGDKVTEDTVVCIIEAMI